MQAITSIHELQKIELSIMEKIHVFCIANKIKYCLGYGTLIGAVRHNGFIPWDDDIDIIMFRKDYDKFLNEFPKVEKDLGLHLASPYSGNHYYPHEYSKVCDSSTALDERMSKVDSKLGVYVDIFVMDNLPENMLLRKIYRCKARVLRRLINAANTNLQTNDYKEHYNVVKQIVIRALNRIPVYKVFQYAEKLSRSCRNETSTFVMNIESDAGMIYKREWFEHVELHTFEDTQFYIPEKYDEILKNGYGDYMKLPEKKNQIPHHIIDAWYK